MSREQKLRTETDSLEKSILVCAALVAFGVILEAVAIFKPAMCLDKIGGCIVAIGLTVEFALGVILWRREKKLDRLLQSQLAGMRLEI